MIIKRLKKSAIDELLKNINDEMQLIMDEAARSDDPYVQYQLVLLKKRFKKTMMTAEKVTKK